MKTIAIVCQKGGAGKTFTTTNLAVAAKLHGLAVAVLDTDPQATSCFWSATRTPAGQPPDISVQPVFPALLDSRLKALELAGCDLAIIDTPPTSKDTASEAIRLADFSLIPMKPAAWDFRSALETMQQCRAQNKPFAILMNLCPPRESQEFTKAIAQLATTNTEVAPVTCHLLTDHVRAAAAGQTAQEYAPTGKAAEEVGQLFKYVLQQIGLATSRRTGKTAA